MCNSYDTCIVFVSNIPGWIILFAIAGTTSAYLSTKMLNNIAHPFNVWDKIIATFFLVANSVIFAICVYLILNLLRIFSYVLIRF